MASNHRHRPRAAAAALAVVACAAASLFFDSSPPSAEFSLGRILLQTEDAPRVQRKQPDVFPWARDHALPLTTAPDPSKETALFWHIPKSGGTTGKGYYRCLRKVEDIGRRPDDILRAAEEGLVLSGQVDIIFSSFPALAIADLFDPDHKARALAVFRHPVDRLVSLFYYLQVATWESSYRPEWKDMDVLEWAEKHNNENNVMVENLAGKVGKVPRVEATVADLALAKRTIQQYFVVGLMTDMAESLRRFDVVMGINGETDQSYGRCRDQYFGKKDKVNNSNKHPKLEKGDPAWDLLAEQNSLDIQLYDYVLDLYEEQKDLVDSYEVSSEISAVASLA